MYQKHCNDLLALLAHKTMKAFSSDQNFTSNSTLLNKWTVLDEENIQSDLRIPRRKKSKSARDFGNPSANSFCFDEIFEVHSVQF